MIPPHVLARRLLTDGCPAQAETIIAMAVRIANLENGTPPEQARAAFMAKVNETTFAGGGK